MGEDVVIEDGVVEDVVDVVVELVEVLLVGVVELVVAYIEVVDELELVVDVEVVLLEDVVRALKDADLAVLDDFHEKNPSQHWEDVRAGFREANDEAES